MADLAKAGAAVVCTMLLLGQCQKDPVSAAKVAGGAAAVGAGVGAGAAGAGALGAAAKGASKGIERRAADRVGRQRPNGPALPYTPTTAGPLVEVGP